MGAEGESMLQDTETPLSSALRQMIMIAAHVRPPKCVGASDEVCDSIEENVRPVAAGQVRESKFVSWAKSSNP
jgi:hypothetical protein